MAARPARRPSPRCRPAALTAATNRPRQTVRWASGKTGVCARQASVSGAAVLKHPPLALAGPASEHCGRPGAAALPAVKHATWARGQSGSFATGHAAAARPRGSATWPRQQDPGGNPATACCARLLSATRTPAALRSSLAASLRGRTGVPALLPVAASSCARGRGWRMPRTVAWAATCRSLSFVVAGRPVNPLTVAGHRGQSGMSAR
mmetsp:Transcript_5717/g.16864  ORF Transcript_5717/g.16864 Transcript_5717/m.16864 type:complete len:207 (-) Transcript_5717:864-1484(-)